MFNYLATVARGIALARLETEHRTIALAKLPNPRNALAKIGLLVAKAGRRQARVRLTLALLVTTVLSTLRPNNLRLIPPLAALGETLQFLAVPMIAVPMGGACILPLNGTVVKTLVKVALLIIMLSRLALVRPLRKSRTG